MKRLLLVATAFTAFAPAAYAWDVKPYVDTRPVWDACKAKQDVLEEGQDLLSCVDKNTPDIPDGCRISIDLTLPARLGTGSDFVGNKVDIEVKPNGDTSFLFFQWLPDDSVGFTSPRLQEALRAIGVVEEEAQRLREERGPEAAKEYLESRGPFELPRADVVFRSDAGVQYRAMAEAYGPPLGRAATARLTSDVAIPGGFDPDARSGFAPTLLGAHSTVYVEVDGHPHGYLEAPKQHVVTHLQRCLWNL
ncbi:hypothetical protein PAF17_03910 [Paracoccus sp. Z330]|uniref:Uncharacterized protein n=1 Tax=Paracoccus onchidii TaxID=3017813 RepID=A0ABT4ZBA2_9RHOB|nr:hypothetical protein [Paracoccus onchidii]MDB6176647.1 hypothetical protein [Paracoccus onchidii]